jgi:hypothetical protein
MNRILLAACALGLLSPQAHGQADWTPEEGKSGIRKVELPRPLG